MERPVFKRRHLLLLLILVLGVYVVVPQIGDFRHSFSLIRHVQWPALSVALACSLLTYIAATNTYCIIAFKRLSYAQTLLVQLASMFVNRLLPGGIGALGSNYAYLRHRRHTPAQAGTVVAANNTLGLIGHFTLFWLLLTVFGGEVPPMRASHGGHSLVWLGIGLVALLVLIACLLPNWRRRLWKGVKNVASEFWHFSKRPRALAGGLLSSMSLTLANVGCLYFCLSAVHGSASIALIMLVFTLGVTIGTATPTPGGLGGFEAGLVAGFIAYNIPSSTALAAALLYRLLTYWLGIILGAVAFAFVERAKLFNIGSS